MIKEDWWLKLDSNGEKTIGPRPELIEQIQRETDIQVFYMYNSERFMRYAQEFLNVQLKKDSLGQVRQAVQASNDSPTEPTFYVMEDLEGAEQLVAKLKTLGFKTSLYESYQDKSPEPHESIWVGSRLSPSSVVKAIKIAKTQWPFLKYVAIPGDHGEHPPTAVSYQLF
jgi:hypothetical protein